MPIDAPRAGARSSVVSPGAGARSALDAIAGHGRPRAFLRRAMGEGRLSHAYLFSGPVGVGKTATALAFAADLLEAAGGPPVTPSHPDLWVEDSAAETIGIDTIRLEARVARGSRDGETSEAEAIAGGGRAAGRGAGVEPAHWGRELWPPPPQSLQAFLALRGLHSDRRVAVLARAERLRETAAAPLLKTIEEPPEGAVLVVCTENPELLPATIRSRCQELAFPRLSDAEVATFLEAQGLSLPPAALRLAGGAPGRALRLAADPDSVARALAWVADLRAIRGAGWLEVVALGARFGGQDSRANRALAREAIAAWETELRDLTVALCGAPELARLAIAEAGGGGVLASPADPAWAGMPVDAAVSLWRAARETADRIQSNVNPRLAIEVFLRDVARGRSETVEAVGSEYVSGVLSPAP